MFGIYRKEFANLYDKIMAYHICHEYWAEYIETLCLRHNLKPETVLDLACGTGTMLIEFSKRGYEVAGLDRSSEMLFVAKKKARQNKQRFKLYEEDFENFLLPDSYDLILCLYDSLNYVSGLTALTNVFYNVYKHLKTDGLFIFDLVTWRKFKSGVYAESRDNFAYIWEIKMDKVRKRVKIQADFFIKLEKNIYKKVRETHIKKIFTKKEVKKGLYASGLKFCADYDAYTLNSEVRNSERIFFVAKKEDNL